MRTDEIAVPLRAAFAHEDAHFVDPFCGQAAQADKPGAIPSPGEDAAGEHDIDTFRVGRSYFMGFQFHG